MSVELILLLTDLFNINRHGTFDLHECILLLDKRRQNERFIECALYTNH